MLPGFMAGRLIGGGGVPGGSPLQLVDSLTSITSSLICPTVQAGDVLVFLDAATNGSATDPGTAIPAGFTLVATAFSVQARATVSCKVANGTEGGSELSAITGTSVNRHVLLVFRKSPVPASVLVCDVGQQGTTSDPTAQIVTAANGPVPLIVLGGYYAASNLVDPRSFSPAEDGEVSAISGSSASAHLKYKIYLASPVDVTVDMQDEGTNFLLSAYLLLDWYLATSIVATGNISGFTNTTFRQLVPSANIGTTGKTKVRITFEAASSGGFSWDAAYVGLKALSGNAYDFDTTPVQLFVGGSPTIAAAAGQLVTTDPATFTIPSGRDIIVSSYAPLSSGYRERNSGPTGNILYRKTVNEPAAVIAESGYTVTSNYTLNIRRIEVGD